MTTSNVDAIALTPSEHQIQLRRAVIAATIGTAIEWYDFFLYSTVTGLVFAKLFFPHSDPWVGTLEAFAIYAVGFVARPVGAAIFGHYGDRIGRKSTLIATLMLMGLATFAVALVPTYASIGVWGAVILTVLRFIQGVGVGGDEALAFGLANRLCEPGEALASALDLAASIAAFPQLCLRTDRRSSYEQWGLPVTEALANEVRLGLEPIRSGETLAGAQRIIELENEIAELRRQLEQRDNSDRARPSQQEDP